ncbi:isl-2b [Amphibalanus amphitrite]|uniref:Isl-2b n=1 Tax=Amphibalanus amphitrite TaxID=1232801 RepID=A0A6A4X4Z6_AMPAM|nr:isl-2b [Amphibalanus amphitrite]
MSEVLVAQVIGSRRFLQLGAGDLTQQFFLRERLFGAKCSKCNKLFSSTDMVMRARDKIFHIDCFRCCVCAKHLVPGDEFALRSEALYCKDDYDCKEQLDSGGGVTKLGAKSPADSGEENVQPKADKEQKKRDGKTTRVRTVLNEKQLHTLRTCYNANPRPDALMKEQMVEMTGLSPRVIRVWFQNKRCKDKKRQIYLRQMQEANKDGRRLSSMLPIQGIHMVASSPVRHDSAAPLDPAGLGGVDITSYQPPWKALHEYALQGDIDPGTPQYQALLSQVSTRTRCSSVR